MDDMLKILLQAEVDTGKIKQQIDEIQEKSKPIKIDVDTKGATNQFTQMSRAMSDAAKMERDHGIASRMRMKEHQAEANKELKAIDSIQEAIRKTIQKRKQENDLLEKRQSMAINKNLEREYKQRIKNIELNNKQEKAEKQKTAALKEQIELFKRRQEIQAKNIETRYKDAYDATALANYRKELEGLDVTTPNVSSKMKHMRVDLSEINAEARSGQINMQSWGKSAFEAIQRIAMFGGVSLSIAGVVRAIKEGINKITELDSAIVELKKVTDEADSTYVNFTNNAFELGKALGRTGTEVIQATADFARMGFRLKEASELAQEALLMLNVGDGIDNIDQATSSIIATLKGFEIEGSDTAKSTRKINDIYNEIANNFATSTGALAEGVRRTSAVMNQAGNSFEETAAMFTGAYEVIQDESKVSSGLNIITQRLKAMDLEGNKIDGLAPKLEGAFNDIGLSLYDTNGELKSTFENLRALTKIYPELSQEQQNYMSELVSGKRQSVVLQAMVSNWESVEGAIVSANESAGSAMAENEKYLDSIEGKTATLASTTEMFWKNLIDSETIKLGVTSLTAIVGLLDTIITSDFSKFIFQIGLITTGVMLARKGMVLYNNSLLQNAIGYTLLTVKSTIATAAQMGFVAATKAATAAMFASPLFAVAATVTGVALLTKAILSVNTSLKEQKEIVDDLTAELSGLQSEYKELSNTKNRNEEQEKYLKLLEREIELKKESQKEETQKLVDKEYFQSGFHGSKSDAIYKEIEDIKKARQDLSKALDNGADINKINSLKSNIGDLELSLIGSFKDIKESADILGEDAPENFVALRDSLESVIELDGEIETTSTEIKHMASSLTELYTKMDETVNESNMLRDAISELDESGKLSKETINKLVEVYPDLIDKTGLQEDAVRSLLEAELTKSREGIIASINENKTIVASARSNIKAYMAEAKALKVLIESRKSNFMSMSAFDMITEDPTDFVNRKNKPYNPFEDSAIEAVKTQGYKNDLKNVNGMLDDQNKSLDDALKALSILENGLSTLDGGGSSKGKSGSKGKGSSKSGGSKSASKAKEEYKATYDIYTKLNLELDKNNILLAKNKTLQDLAGDDLAKKIELMQKEVELNKSRQNSLNSYNNEQRKEVAELEKSLSGHFKFAGKGDNRMITNLENIQGKTKEVETAFKRYIQLQKDEIPKASQEWWNLQKSIEDVSKSIEESTKKSVREFIEAEKRNAYMDLELRQRKANDRIKALKDEMDREVNYYQGIIDRAQKDIDDIQEEEDYRNKQKDKLNRLDEISKLQDKYYELQYGNLEDLTEQQAKSLGLEKERAEYLEKQAKIQELLIRLENVRREKNIQQLTKNEDGTWGFDYVADQKEIDSITKDIDTLQEEHSKNITDLKESTLADLQQKQEDYDEWERQNEIQREIERKRDRIQRYQDEIKDLQDKHKAREDEINEALNTEKENLDRYYTDIDILTDEKMKELLETFDGNWIAIQENLKSHFEEIKSEYKKLVDEMSKPLPGASSKSSGGSGGSSSSYSSSSRRSESKADERAERDSSNSSYDSSNSSEVSRISKKHGVDKSVAREMSKTNDRTGKKVYHKGGIVGDGSRDLPDIANAFFNEKLKPNEQIVKALKGELMIPEDNIYKNFLPNAKTLMDSFNIPALPRMDLSKSGGGDIKQAIHIGKLEFPNVRDAKEIEDAVGSLSTYAEQWANRK